MYITISQLVEMGVMPQEIEAKISGGAVSPPRVGAAAPPHPGLEDVRDRGVKLVDLLRHARRVVARQDRRQQGSAVPFLRFGRGDLRNGSPTLAGTLITPSTKGPHPAVVYIEGSSDRTRDDACCGNVEIRSVLARGVAFLLYDKRGTGGSGGDWHTSSMQDLAADALLIAGSNMGPKRGFGGMLPRLVSRFPATAAEGGCMPPRNLMLSVLRQRATD